MVRVHKYDSKRSRIFRVTSNEVKRADDDVTIVVRPQDAGTHGVFAVDVSVPGEAKAFGVNWYEVDEKSEIPAAITSLQRDLDKFHGRGGKMSYRGRHRRKDEGLGSGLASELEVGLTEAAGKTALERATRFTGTALRWLQAGAPSSAAEDLSKAAAVINGDADLKRLPGLHTAVKHGLATLSGSNPRGADDVVEKALRLLKGARRAESIEEGEDLTEANNGRVSTFLTIMMSELTQLDRKLHASETKRGGRGNIYRLGHYMDAMDKVAEAVKGDKESDSPEAMGKLKAAIGKQFESDFPPAKKTIKQIDAFLTSGRLPKVTIEKPSKSNEDVELDEADEMNKPSFRVGARVQFSPGSRTASMYREYHPKKGEMGTVVSNQYGRWPSDNPRKGSGAVKVKWDKAGLQTVHPDDAKITGGKSAKAESSGFADALGDALRHTARADA